MSHHLSDSSIDISLSPPHGQILQLFHFSLRFQNNFDQPESRIVLKSGKAGVLMFFNFLNFSAILIWHSGFSNMNYALEYCEKTTSNQPGHSVEYSVIYDVNFCESLTLDFLDSDWSKIKSKIQIC